MIRKKIIIMIVVLRCSLVSAQEKAEQSATDLAKKTQNPVADWQLQFQIQFLFPK